MFSVGQKVKGSESLGMLAHAELVVLDVYDDGTFDAEVLFHPDEDLIGEIWEELETKNYVLISSPKGTHGFVGMPAVSKSISTPSVSSAADMMAIGLI